MSYNQNPGYAGYSTAPNYYTQNLEEFIQDYTDNNGLSDQQALQSTHPHVTEIYSRNDATRTPQRQVVANQLGYQYVQQNQGQYMQQYYYENPTSQTTKRFPLVPYEDYAQTYDPRVHQYCPLTTSSLHDTTYDPMAYSNTQHNINVAMCPRSYQGLVKAAPVQKQQNVKRYPVKVGTPKYYRKLPSNTLCKRPSALCLPVASQPDPAVHRRHKKPTTEIQYGFPQNVPLTNDVTDTQLLKKTSEQIVTDHVVGSEGDFNLKASNLDEIFAQIEKSDMPKGKRKGDVVKFAKFLKPRVPPSVKAKEEKAAKAEVAGDNPKEDKTEQQDEAESMGDSIERLLNQLKKCELAVCSDDFDKISLKNESQNVDNDKEKSEEKKMPPIRTSFNYRDITDQMSKSRSEMNTFEADIEHSSEIAKHLNVSMSTSRGFLPKPPMDDHCALELHRSKSYIVNLIDRALSKELGTIPSHRIHREFTDMSPRKAIDMMNRHGCGKSNKELSLEISTKLTDSIISNATAPEAVDINMIPSTSSSKAKVCCCNMEEPPYIKQLKQLRWGHLKHIQREVRRLEDLERFLDSCSLHPISEI